MLAERLSNPDRPYVEVYAILLRDDKDGDVRPRMIGTVGAPRNGPQGAEIAYGLHPDYWGKGYMIEALKLFIGVYWGPGSAFPLYFPDDQFQYVASICLLGVELLENLGAQN